MNLYLRERTLDSIKPAERFVLDTLRATELKKMRDDDWSGLERRVAQVGLKNVDGWYGDQLRKAIRTLVAKHGGHGDQSVHGGGKKGGSAPAPSEAPSGGGGGSTTPKAEITATYQKPVRDKATRSALSNDATMKLRGAQGQVGNAGMDAKNSPSSRQKDLQRASSELAMASRNISQGKALEKDFGVGEGRGKFKEAKDRLTLTRSDIAGGKLGNTAKTALPDIDATISALSKLIAE